MVRIYNPPKGQGEGRCLWCGVKLRRLFDDEHLEKLQKEVYKPITQETAATYRKLYGYGGDNFFCTLGCGYAFGKAFAELGKRLQPLRGKEVGSPPLFATRCGREYGDPAQPRHCRLVLGHAGEHD